MLNGNNVYPLEERLKRLENGQYSSPDVTYYILRNLGSVPIIKLYANSSYMLGRKWIANTLRSNFPGKTADTLSVCDVCRKLLSARYSTERDSKSKDLMEVLLTPIEKINDGQSRQAYRAAGSKGAKSQQISDFLNLSVGDLEYFFSRENVPRGSERIRALGRLKDRYGYIGLTGIGFVLDDIHERKMSECDDSFYDEISDVVAYPILTACCLEMTRQKDGQMALTERGALHNEHEKYA